MITPLPLGVGRQGGAADGAVGTSGGNIGAANNTGGNTGGGPATVRISHAQGPTRFLTCTHSSGGLKY